jgi:hypothetical protein
MKKIISMFAIMSLLALAAFGQEPAKVAPTKIPKPAARGKAANARPTPVTPAQAPTPRVANVTIVEPAAEANVATIAPVAAQSATPTLTSEAVTVLSPATVTPAPAVQSPTTPTARIATAGQPPVAVSPTPQAAPAVASQATTLTPLQETRPVAARPATSLTGQQGNLTTAAPAAKEPEYISEKGFKGKVFEVKYRDPNLLSYAVSALGSGFKGATIRFNDEFKTITVRDFPENIATIEEALKRLDTPQPPPRDIEFRVQVLIAANTPAQGEEYPSDLNEVVKQLQATLKYKNYSLMIAATHRTKASHQGVTNNGVAESKLFNVTIPAGNQIFYEYGISQIGLDSSNPAGTTVQIGIFSFGLRIPLVLGSSTDPKIQYQNVGFRSPVSLREGEKVVVGTTTMGDKGLIVVLTAKVSK